MLLKELNIDVGDKLEAKAVDGALVITPIATKPKILEVLNTLPELPDRPAIIAPTMITDEIALVTDINGVCKDGVTLQTT